MLMQREFRCHLHDMDSFLSGLGMDNQNSSIPKDEAREGPSVEDWIASPYSGPDQLARVEAYNATLLASPAFRFAAEGEGPPGLSLPLGTWPPQEFAHREPAGFVGNSTKTMFGGQWGAEGGRREGSGAVPSGAGMADSIFRNVGCQPSILNDGGTLRGSASGDGRSDTVDAKAVNRSHLTQKRYREKQKAKTADLVTRVEHYQVKTQALQDQKADLIGRNKMLLELLQERDTHIAELQAGRGMRSAHTLTAHPALQPDPDGTSHSDACQQSPAEALAESLSVALTLTVADKPICLTQEQMRGMSPANLAKFWKEYVAKLALLLVAAENKGAPDHLLQRVEQLTEEALAIMTSFSHPNPISTKQFVSQKVEEDQGIFAREESHEAWLHTAESLRLTPAQQAEVKQLRDAYLGDIDGVLVRRADAVRELVESGSHRVSMRKAALFYLKVLTPVQRARYMVQAYPWIPDHLAFATAVAAQGGDVEAKQSLQMLHQDWSVAADSSSM